jgi:hypothetical protein
MSDDKSKTPERPPLDTEVASQAQDPFSTLFMGLLRTNDPLLIERGLRYERPPGSCGRPVAAHFAQ